MKIALVLKDDLCKQPPTLSVCYHLLTLGVELTIIVRNSNHSVHNDLEKKGAKIYFFNDQSYLGKLPKIGNLWRWKLFRNEVKQILSQLQFDYLWIATADAGLALGSIIFKYNYIIHIQELYDQFPRYRHALKPLLLAAKKVFGPEETRAHIFRAWYRLKETPVVLPNKPYYHPRQKGLPISNIQAAKAFAKIPTQSKIVFYQGGISNRRDLKPIATAIKELGAPWALAVQCPIVDNEYYRDFFENYEFYHIPYVPAPLHLEITSNIDFGLVTYSHVSLNNEFCAPNKIWEYSGFGLPIIANDVWGLKNTVERFHAGLSLNLDQSSIDELKEALIHLDENQAIYASNATKLYESINNGDILKRNIEDLEATLG